ncbi:MAG: DsbA family protein [Candidatus Omnitrophica bacterium]|nr:DsbA family protein [Candidatus Omnitrophota bacterium]
MNCKGSLHRGAVLAVLVFCFFAFSRAAGASSVKGLAYGDPKAPITIVEYTDFECPFCGSVQPALQEVLRQYPGQVRLVFRNFPLPMHRHARQAHTAAMCANEQGKFWEYRNHLFQNQRALEREKLVGYAKKFGLSAEKFESCMDENRYQSTIDQDIEEGLAAGVQGTPAFLINGKLLTGAQPFLAFQRIIEKELRRTA